MGKRSGFTLVELVIVIVIIGILAAIAIPKFTDLSKSAELALSKDFAAKLRTASEVYYARLVMEGATANPFDFNKFVGYTSSGSARNTIIVPDSLHDLLTNTNVATSNTQLVFNFKSGASATYNINSSTRAITDSYSGF